MKIHVQLHGDEETKEILNQLIKEIKAMPSIQDVKDAVNGAVQQVVAAVNTAVQAETAAVVR